MLHYMLTSCNDWKCRIVVAYSVEKSMGIPKLQFCRLGLKMKTKTNHIARVQALAEIEIKAILARTV